MSTLKSIIFSTLPDPEEYYETAEALRDLDRDGKLDREEFFNAIKAILPAILGGVAGVMIGGPAGAAIGLTIGTLISLHVMDFDYSGIIHKFQEFFVDLTGFYDKEWNSWTDVVHGLWEGLKTWWHGLSLGRFDFKLPHLTVSWQELGANSILARYLGITAIPHMGVEWYARGGIVDGATLIGAGEQGKEAIIPWNGTPSGFIWLPNS